MPSRLNKQTVLTLLVTLLLISTVSGCTTAPLSDTRQVPVPFAQVTFLINVETSKGQEGLGIEFFDELTGLSINPNRYKLSCDQSLCQITLPFPAGSILKYRYIKDTQPVTVETTASGLPIRYRIFQVTNNVTNQDLIAGWPGALPEMETGRINGRVVDSRGNPLADVFVSSAGITALTGGDGSFLLEGLLPGKYNLSAISASGNYQIFHQEAIVDSGATTPALIVLTPSTYVEVTLRVKTPEETAGLPLRVIGNLSSLGNTYSDLNTGLSVIASRGLSLTYQSDGVYSITLRLPVGYDLRYRYTLGDGFWNSEYAENGSLRSRQYIVPPQNAMQNDVIDTWAPLNAHPVAFTVSVPGNTPVSDNVSIQFNAFGWSTPIPMWSLGNNQWYYILYNQFDQLSYRYCRNDQCGVADDAMSPGQFSSGRLITKDQTSISDIVDSWQWWNPENVKATITANNVPARGSEFIAGVEYQSNYMPSWQSQYPNATANIKDLGANTIIVPTPWDYAQINPPVLAPVPGASIVVDDFLAIDRLAKQSNIQTMIYPVSWVQPVTSFWREAGMDESWWNAWFDQYNKILQSNAYVAAQTDAAALIIGEPYLMTAITGILPDGSPSNLVPDYENRWKGMIAELRSIYSGNIYWAVEYAQTTPQIPTWASALDGFYILWHAPLVGDATNYNLEDAVLMAENHLVNGLLPIFQQYQKPIIIGVDYASVPTSLQGCIRSGDLCSSFVELNQPQSTDARSISVDFQAQVDAYTAVLTAASHKEWVSGFVSRQYYPPAFLQDNSSSVHGKPAADVLWYWYPRLIAETVQ